MAITVPEPEQQIEFSVALAENRRRYLQEALRDSAKTLDIAALGRQLEELVPTESLAMMGGGRTEGESLLSVIAA